MMIRLVRDEVYIDCVYTAVYISAKDIAFSPWTIINTEVGVKIRSLHVKREIKSRLKYQLREDV